MRTTTLATTISVIALCGFGPCETVTLNSADNPELAPTVEQAGPTFGDSYCYFASQPYGARQCVAGPCRIEEGRTATCTTPRHRNYLVGEQLFSASLEGRVEGFYNDPAHSYPSCRGGADVFGQASD